MQENNKTDLTREEMAIFCKAISGKDELGESKVVLSYQSYDFDEPEDSINKQQVYTTKNPYVELSFDSKFPQFYVMDIIFQSYNDPELRMLWGRLQRFKKNQAMNGEKTWIFYMNLLMKSSVTMQTVHQDTLLFANVFNPTIFYLTREIPNYLAVDTSNEDNELYGGNIIRMLIPIEFISFDIRDDIDTLEIKGEAQRMKEEARYINESENYKSDTNWY